MQMRSARREYFEAAPGISAIASACRVKRYWAESSAQIEGSYLDTTIAPLYLP